MDKKYLKYSVEDFTQDRLFILWVKKGKNRLAWSKFLKDNPEKIKEMETSRKIIELLESNQSEIQEEEVYAIWHNVDHFYNLFHQRRRKLVLKKLLQYAAIFILAFSIGVTIPYFYFKNRLTQFSGINITTTTTTTTTTTNKAKLILADGAEIILNNDESNLEFDEAGENISIDNDSIVSQSFSRIDDRLVMNQVITPYGKRANLQLSDGTKVWLNAGSKLVFPPKFNAKTRRVYLRGEAYFDVAENKKNPFVVFTTDVNITVLGTEFNVSAYTSDNELATVLVEGEICIKENNVFGIGGKGIILKPRQKAVYDKNSNTTSVAYNVDLDYYTSWKEGVFKFKTESILNVFKRLARYYNVEIITERSLDVNNKITGKLDLKDSLEDVLKVIEDVAPITFTIDQNRVFVYDKLYYLPMKKQE